MKIWSYYFFAFVFVFVDSLMAAEHETIRCTLQIQSISAPERVCDYSRATSYYVTESKHDINLHTLQLFYVAMMLEHNLTLEQVEIFKKILKTAPRECSYCEFKPFEVYELLERKSMTLFQKDMSSLNQDTILTEIKNFYEGIPHLQHENPYSYYSYSVYNLICTNDESGEVISQRLHQDEIYQYATTLPKPSEHFSFYSKVEDEDKERALYIREYAKRHERFILYLKNSTALSAHSKIKKALYNL